jgi:ferredoxin-NADP reductase
MEYIWLKQKLEMIFAILNIHDSGQPTSKSSNDFSGSSTKSPGVIRTSLLPPTTEKVTEHYVKIKLIEKVSHDVLRIRTEKPKNFKFIPGQYAELSINKDDWYNEKRPFCFTGTPEDDYLEFTVKIYASHRGVSNELLKLKKEDELILHEVAGTINYKGEGIFIAGGTGITPFISIFRSLKKSKIGKNKLIFGNKTKADILFSDELDKLFGKNLVHILSEEKTKEYAHGFISKEFLAKQIDDTQKYFYLCGPPGMMDAVEEHLMNLHVRSELIVKEIFF